MGKVDENILQPKVIRESFRKQFKVAKIYQLLKFNKQWKQNDIC